MLQMMTKVADAPHKLDPLSHQDPQSEAEVTEDLDTSQPVIQATADFDPSAEVAHL